MKYPSETHKEPEINFGDLSEHSLAGFYLIQQDGLLRYVNSRCAEILGYKVEEVIDTLRVGDVIFPEDWPMVKESLGKRISGELPSHHYEFRIVTKNKDIKYVETYSSLTEYEGKPAIIGTLLDITDRKRAEEALQESERKFRDLSEKSVAGVYLVQDGIFRYANSMFAQLLGYTVDEMIDKVTAEQVIFPEDWPLVEGNLRKRISGELESLHYEFRVVTKNKETKNAEVYSSRTMYGGKPAVIGTFLDITDRRRAEEALRESKRQYDNLVSNIPVGVYILRTTPAGGFVFEYASPRMAQMLAVPAESILTDPQVAFQPIHPEELEDFNKLNRERIEARQPFLWEGRAVVTGAVKWLRIESRPEPLDNGDVLWHGIVADITERKLAEQQLQSERETFFSILQNAPYGMFVHDPHGGLLFINHEATNITGYLEEDIPEGRVLFKKMYPDQEYRTKVIRTWVQDVSSSGIDRVFSVHCKDGRIKELEFRAFRLHDGKGITIFSDITGRRRAAEEKRNLESQLLQAQKMEAIGTLAGGIAHDFNNLLTSLMGYASLMQMKMDESSPLRPYVDQVLSASEKAADLTKSLLAFSRQQPVTLVPLDINNAIKATKELLKRLLTEDIELRTSLTSGDAVVMADRSQMDQILFNLVTNARDAMPKGGTLAIETDIADMGIGFIRVHGFGEPGRYVRINISDTGTGIDEAIREKIFDPFFTTKEIGKGTGLGLATVYGIIKQHYGYITVESEPGHGTTFRIYLPAARMKVNEKQDAATPIESGKETILIAEDDEGVRYFIREALRQCGYKTIEAIDGEDAIDKFNRHRNIDLVIIDSVMPKKNGREVYEEVHGTDPHVRVLFTSGYTKDIVLDKGIEDREFDFIAKPLSFDKLLQKVREVLDS